MNIEETLEEAKQNLEAVYQAQDEAIARAIANVEQGYARKIREAQDRVNEAWERQVIEEIYKRVHPLMNIQNDLPKSED